jgi:hypothetical protein
MAHGKKVRTVTGDLKSLAKRYSVIEVDSYLDKP